MSYSSNLSKHGKLGRMQVVMKSDTKDQRLEQRNSSLPDSCISSGLDSKRRAKV